MKTAGFFSVDDYLSLPRDAETWLIKPLIPVSGAALLYGQEKSGKSYLAIQLALAISGGAEEWLGFPIVKHGTVLDLQLDTPRSVWAWRFEEIVRKFKTPYNKETLKLADRETLEVYPFDILKPQELIEGRVSQSHMTYLKSIIALHQPVAVIIDTLRESHSGDEDSSTVSRNVITNLVAATAPAALILISHSRKPHPDVGKNIMADHRGSSYITGRMDAILRLTPKHLYYSGRSIEEGSINLDRQENGLWLPAQDETAKPLAEVLADSSLPTMRAKARALAPLIKKSEEAAMSMIRRAMAGQKVKKSDAPPPPTPPIATAVKGIS